jgi:hypothetical protein
MILKAQPLFIFANSFVNKLQIAATVYIPVIAIPNG